MNILLWKEQQKECSRLVFRSLRVSWTENTDSLPDKSMEVQAVTALYTQPGAEKQVDG